MQKNRIQKSSAVTAKNISYLNVINNIGNKANCQYYVLKKTYIAGNK
jgi:hypothetical protein